MVAFVFVIFSTAALCWKKEQNALLLLFAAVVVVVGVVVIIYIVLDMTANVSGRFSYKYYSG